MTIQDLIQAGEFDKAVQQAIALKTPFETPYEDIAKQYNTPQHDIFDKTIKPDKTVLKPRLDSNGQQVVDEQQRPVFITKLEPLVRVGQPYQKIIVARRIGFLLGNPVEIEIENYDGKKSIIYSMTKTIWDDNKLNFKNRTIAEKLMSEREVAELWYLKEDPEFWKKKSKGVGATISSPARLKVLVCSPSLGDELIPVFDEFGDMTAFFRKYKIIEDGKDTEMMDVFTNELLFTLTKKTGNYELFFRPGEKQDIKNPFGKIPIVYYRQEHPEWHDVQSLIDRKESSLSNIGDENDYFGKPILFMKGTIAGMANKTDGGKVLQGTGDASAEFLSWAHAPESIKLEFSELEASIYKFSQTPDLSFEAVKGVGAVSGIALRFLFIDAHMAARTKETIFGEGIQRRLNLISYIAGNIINVNAKTEANEISLYPKFTPYMPDDIKEAIELLVTGKEGGILSVKTAVNKNPIVSDPEAEMEELDKQAANTERTYQTDQLI